MIQFESEIDSELKMILEIDLNEFKSIIAHWQKTLQALTFSLQNQYFLICSTRSYLFIPFHYKAGWFVEGHYWTAGLLASAQPLYQIDLHDQQIAERPHYRYGASMRPKNK